MNTTRRGLAAAGLSALGLLATAAPAAAATVPTTGPDGSDFTTMRGTCVELENAIGCFESVGDHVYVHDDAADGRKPSVQWHTNYGREGQCTWRGTSYWTDCNYNMREDSYITFRLILRSVNGSQFWASQWVDAYVGE
jgi:hypothetical protein